MSGPTPLDPDDVYGPRRRPTPTGMSAVDVLLAYEDIRQLAARFAVAMDARDFEGISYMFIEDYVHWDGQVGRDKLRAAMEDGFKGEDSYAGDVSFALNGTHLINLLEPDRAAGTLYAKAEFGGLDNWIYQAIVYLDDYERRDGVWYFTRRDHQLFYGLEVERRPFSQGEANWPHGRTGRGSMPFGWRRWREYTGKAGIDG